MVSGSFDAPPRRAFRLRTPLTLMVLVALLAGATWYAVDRLNAPPEASPPPLCTPRRVTKVPTGAAAAVAVGQVRVTVFNTKKGRPGLAGAVSAQLQSRGFVTGTPGNDYGTVTGTGVVRAADPSLPSVALVLAQVRGARFEKVNRYDPSVDLVIGPAFRTLEPKFPRSVKVTTRSTLFPPDPDCRAPGVPGT